MIKLTARARDISTKKYMTRTVSNKKNCMISDERLEVFVDDILVLNRRYGDVHIDAIVTPEDGARPKNINDIYTVKVKIMRDCKHGVTRDNIVKTLKEMVSEIESSLNEYRRYYI